MSDRGRSRARVTGRAGVVGRARVTGRAGVVGRARVTGRARVAAVALLIVVVAGACGGEAPSSGASGSPKPTAAGNVPAGSATLSPLVVDPRLLSILPVSVAGVAVKSSPETAANMVGNASLGESASAIAVGVAIAPGDSLGDDLAVATLVRLRPGVFDDAFYGRWRAAYDAAACEPAGGVSSHVQRLIGPHTVDVTVCAQGARTYHTHLTGDVLVSITATGARKFGDLVMAGLRR